MITYDAVMQRAAEYLHSEKDPNKSPADIGTVAMIVQSIVDLTNAELVAVMNEKKTDKKAGPSGQYVTVKTYQALKAEVERLRKEVESTKSE